MIVFKYLATAMFVGGAYSNPLLFSLIKFINGSKVVG